MYAIVKHILIVNNIMHGYMIAAVGCPDYVAPANELVKRHGMTLKIGCLSTDDVWELKCNDSQWTGAGKSCPDPLVDPSPTTPASSLSAGMSMSS